MTHLNDLSRIYKDFIAEKKDDSYLETDMKKRQKNNEKARKEMEKIPGQKNPHFEEVEIGEAVKGQDSEMRKAAAAERKAGDKRLSSSSGKANADKMERDIKFYDKVTKKTKPSIVGMTHEALDPVGREDADIDNDGDTDKSDKYLHKRRKAIAKAMKKRMSEGVRDLDPEKGTAERKARLEKKRGMKLDDHPEYKKEDVEVPSGDLKKLVKKAVKRVDSDVDGDVDHNDPKAGKFGEFVPSADGKKRITTSMGESFSNWRQDLSEVMGEGETEKKIKEKKVNNKIKINPKLGESVEEIGGTLLEEIEVDEFDYVVESVYEELIEEGFSEDDVEFGIESALNTLDEGYYDSAVASSKAAAKKSKGSLKDRVKSAAKKAIMGTARAAGKAMKAKATAQAAPAKAKAKVGSIVDRVKRIAKKGYESGRGPVEKTTTYRGSGVGRKEKIGEATEDSLRDRRMERGGVDGNTRYDKAPKFASGPSKKKYDGMSAVDAVKADIRAKYGKGAIMDTKKK